MCAAGVLLASQGISARLRGSRWGVGIEGLGTAIAYLSKEAAIVLPLFAVVEAWAVERSPLIDTNRRRVFQAAAPQLVIAVVYWVGRRIWLPIGAHPAAIDLATHVASVLESVGRYIALSAWPGDLALGRAFVVQTASKPPLVNAHVVLAAVALAGAIGAVMAFHRRRPALCIGLVLFLAALVPVSNVVRIGYSVLVSPRFLYLPLIGLGLVAADVLGGVTSRSSVALRRLALGVSAVVVSALFVRSTARAADFDSEERFWSYERAQTPHYPPALLYGVSRSLSERRPRAALRLARDAHAQLLAVSPQDPSRVELMLMTLRAVMVLTPDVSRDDLAGLGRFIHDLRAGRPARFESTRLDMVLDVRAHDLRDAFHARDLELLLLSAEISSRLGDDANALAGPKQLAMQCPHCWTLMQPAILVAARAHELALARELLGNLVQDAADAFPELGETLGEATRVMARSRDARPSERALLDTQYFALLGAWGRAYSAAGPALADPESLDPGSAARLGELAFRAGDMTMAERLLQRALSPRDVRVRFDELAQSMHWVDAREHEAIGSAEP
jgi:hypothetical protein